jgi:hypothetical protein
MDRGFEASIYDSICSDREIDVWIWKTRTFFSKSMMFFDGAAVPPAWGVGAFHE